jgi:hypothetical protein
MIAPGLANNTKGISHSPVIQRLRQNANRGRLGMLPMDTDAAELDANVGQRR